MNKTNPRENTRVRFFMSIIAEVEYAGLLTDHSRGAYFISAV